MRILILGTGIAGLSAALKFAKSFSVTLVAKVDAGEGATRYAQGGIASVWSKTDSFEDHERDTLIAGAGLCHEDIVHLCITEGPARVQELIDLGVQFTRRDFPISPGDLSKTPHSASALPEPSDTKPFREDLREDYDLHKEGGHGKRRILHADDFTGQEIERALLKAARENKNIEIVENHIAIDLITDKKWLKKKENPASASAGETGSSSLSENAKVLGAYLLNSKTGKIQAHSATATVLATGGAGKIYLYTSNPDISTGDGIAMAYRAGAKVANLEFMQFHPTCLYHPLSKNFLISEALRGEGAVLRNLRGEEFMPRYHSQANLAPRDIVTRAIDLEMKRSGDRHVLLDATHLPREWIHKKFPNIFEKCWELGIDIAVDPIPVVPAAHYMCGGVWVDENGCTSLKGLYAVGETACTGLHGANRLASNSLLEAVVFANRVVEHASEHLHSEKDPASLSPTKDLPAWDSGTAVPLEEQLDINSCWLEVRTLMWNYVGIVRSNSRLERAHTRLKIIKKEVDEFYWKYLLTRDLVELRNLVLVSDLIVQSAMKRKESRGLHYTVNYPQKDDSQFLKDTIL